MTNHEHISSENYESAEILARIEALEEVCDTSLDMLDINRLNDVRESTETNIIRIRERIILLKEYIAEIDNDLAMLKAKKIKEQQLLEQINAKIQELSQIVNGLGMGVVMKAKSIHDTGVRHGKTEAELMQKTHLDANEDTPTIENIFNGFPREVSRSIEDHKVIVEEYAEHRAKQIVHEQEKAAKEQIINEIDEQINEYDDKSKEVTKGLNELDLQLSGIREQYVNILKQQLRIFSDDEELAIENQNIHSELETIIEPFVVGDNRGLNNHGDTEVIELPDKPQEIFAGVEATPRVRISVLAQDVEKITGKKIKVGGQ